MINLATNKRLAGTLAMSLLALTLACSAQASPANEVSHAHKHRHHYEESGYQKPGAPVSIASKTQYRLDIGQQRGTELILKLAPGNSQVRLQPDEGLVVNGPSRWQTSELQSQQTLLVTPLAAQKAYIHVYVEHTSPQGHTSTRALAVAIDSRGAQQALKATKAAKPFVEMQATETIY